MIIHSLLPTDLLFKVTEGGVEDRVGAPSDAAKVALIVTHSPKSKKPPTHHCKQIAHLRRMEQKVEQKTL